MGTQMTKKNTYLVMLLVLLFIACLGTGIYFLLQPKNSETISYNVNRYEDLTNWCDTNTVDDKLNLDCKALLLEIRIIDTNNSCTDIQVITKENELKNISICEKNEEITFSNDVLGYKRLMPIDLALTYTKDNTTNKYSLETTTVSKLDDAYIQSIVIKDISSLISTTIDRTFTEKTVENGSKYLSANEDTYTLQTVLTIVLHLKYYQTI